MSLAIKRYEQLKCRLCHHTRHAHYPNRFGWYLIPSVRHGKRRHSVVAQILVELTMMNGKEKEVGATINVTTNTACIFL